MCQQFLFRYFFLFTLLLPSYSFLYAGGGAKTNGYIKNGDAIICVGDVLTLELVTDLPNPKVKRWMFKKSGEKNFNYTLFNNNGLHRELSYQVSFPSVSNDNVTQYRVTYESGGKEYHSSVTGLTVKQSGATGGKIHANYQEILPTFPPQLITDYLNYPGYSTSLEAIENKEDYYTWQSSIDQVKWTDIENSNSEIMTLPCPAPAIKTYYRRKVSNQWHSCSVTSNVVYAHLYKIAIEGEGGTSYEYQRANTLRAITRNNTPLTFHYWQKSVNGGDWVYIKGENGTYYTPFEVTAGEYRYRIGMHYLGANDFAFFSEPKTIIYYPALNPGNITPATQSVLEGTLPDELIGSMPSGGKGNYTYQWQVQNSDGFWTNIEGAVHSNYQVSVGESGHYRRFVVDELGFSTVSNISVVTIDSLNPGLIGHNSTIGVGRNGRPRTWVSASPTNGTEFKWESQTSIDGVTYGEWSNIQDWSADPTYTPDKPLSSSYTRYRRLARVVSEGRPLSSNMVTIRLSDTDPGGIVIPTRTHLVQYDTLGYIFSDPDSPTTFGTERRFKWQKDTPVNGVPQGLWTDLTSWVSDTSYNYNTPLTEAGVHTFRRQFVQDVNNIGDLSKTLESNEVTVYVESLQGGKITISDTIVSRDAIPSRLTDLTSGNGKFYQWQCRNADDFSVNWTNLTPWIENGLEYTPTEGMTIPRKQYRRLCKTLLSTSDAQAVSSNVITVEAQVVRPGFVSSDLLKVVSGGQVNLRDIDSGSGTVYQWQVKRQLEDGTWGIWENLNESFSSDNLFTQDVNVRFTSQYRRLSKLTAEEPDQWSSFSNVITVEVESLSGGEISGDQEIVKNDLPARFTSVSSGNGEVYAWYRKREGESHYSAITDWGHHLDYQEETPVEVTSYYRRLVKLLSSNLPTDTAGSNSIVVKPVHILSGGSIALNSGGVLDTTVNVGFMFREFYNLDEGTGNIFKWQKSLGDGDSSWIDVTDWGYHLTYQDPTSVSSNVLYRRCTKAARSSSDRSMSFSNTLSVQVNRLDGGFISGDTTLTLGDVPHKFLNINSGEGSVYKWQKKSGNTSWEDLHDWSPEHLDYQENQEISTITYYRRLNKTDMETEDSRATSSNIIKILLEELTTRDETVNAQDFYLTVDEVSGLTDDQLISRAQARAMDNITFMSVEFTKPIFHTIQGTAGTYRATFSTGKGESKTVKVYVTEDYVSTDEIILFARPFTLYTTELSSPVSDSLLLLRSFARGYHLNTQSPVALSVQDRTLLDDALTSVPVTLGTYPVVLKYLGSTISVDVTIGEGAQFEVSFDRNFEDVNNGNILSPVTVVSGQRYGNLPTPVRQGAEFLYWSLDVEGLTPVDSNTIVGSLPGTDVEHTLYGIWKYSVTLDLTGGEGDTAIFVQQYRPYQYFQQFPVPQRKGYLFAGWSFDAAGLTLVEGHSMVEQPKEHTLYALWEAREITVIFDASGGIVSPDRQTVLYNSSYGTLPTPTHGYYDFLGWFMGDGRLVSPSEKLDTVALEITLYAKYSTYSQSGNDRYVVTPNGDGLNDRLYLQFLWSGKEDLVSDVQVYIYDRSGVMVYSQKNYQQVDGEFDGGTLSDGTYIVSVHYTENGKKEVYNATITIVR